MDAQWFFFPAKLEDVSRYLARVFEVLGPRFDYPAARIAVSEALLNAIVYGALQVRPPPGERDVSLYLRLVQEAERRASPTTGVLVELPESHEEEATVLVRDPGPGFPWRGHVSDHGSIPPCGATRGRGIGLMRAGSRSVAWNERGNEVTLVLRRADRLAEGRPGSSSYHMKAALPVDPEAPAARRVLVVDDVESNRFVAQRMLEFEGYLVTTAVDGPGAIEAARRLRPSLMLIDLHMPKMTGLEVISTLAGEGLLVDMVAVLTTASVVDGNMRAAGLDAGASDFLCKPIARRELLSRVRRAIEVNERFRRVAVELGDLRESVEGVAAVMAALMPAPRLQPGAADVATLVMPAYVAGGDVVDVMQLGQGRWVVLLVDVAGHGMASALTAASTRALLRDRIASSGGLSAAFCALNRRMYEDFPTTQQHVAVAALLVDEPRGVIEVLNAGCPPVALFLRDGSSHLVASSMPPLGVMEHICAQKTSFVLDEVWRAILVSDGITESFASPSDTFGALAMLCAPESSADVATLPVERARERITRLGRGRDDASVAWIDFHSSPTSGRLAPFTFRE
jgi:sigma-B regulation protein RsbU (phosphoserine phosphatase)